MGNSIRLLLCTGMRSQELLALEPRHIAKDGSYIYILQAVNLVKGTVKIGPPKSKDSIRNIPIPENYRCYAMALRDTNKKFIWEVGKPGVPCNPTYFRDKFREYLSMVDGVRILTYPKPLWSRRSRYDTALSARSGTRSTRCCRKVRKGIRPSIRTR